MTSASSQPIKLESEVIRPSEDRNSPGISSYSAQTSRTDYRLLQFERPVGVEQRKELESELDFISYVPENAWLVELEGSRSEVLSDPLVRYLGPYRPGYKVSPGVETESDRLTVKVQVFPSRANPEDALADHGEVLQKAGENSWMVETSGENISEIASISEVRWISSETPSPTSFNDDSRALINADAVQSSPYRLNGTGYTAAVWDDGWAGNHTDLNYTDSKLTIGDLGEYCGGTKIGQERYCEINSHPTHVSGTLLGAGIKDYTYRGVAPNASLITYEWPTNDSISAEKEAENEINESIQEFSVVVSQNSWGFKSNSLAGNYTSAELSRVYDSIVHGVNTRVNGNVSVVFSAANFRDDVARSYNTTMPPGTAKNVITVGAVDDVKSMTNYSSWGPTDDQRIKPDLVADGGDCFVGSSIKSTVPIDSYSEKCGTSMAAPAVSGAVILVNQKYNRTFGEKPDPDTVKGLLIQNAEDLNRTGPDYITGWGLVDIKESVDYIDSADMKDLIKTGEINDTSNSDTYSFNLSNRSANITLVWSDYPASPGSGEALVNDLDLNVTNSTGHRFYPWTLNYSSRTEPAFRSRKDTRNNVEQVYIPNGTGRFTVEVNGTDVPQPNQSYSLLLDTTVGDLEPPELTVESPGNLTYAETPDFNLTANENLTDANFTVDGGEIRGMDNSSSRKFYNLTTELSDGSHDVNFTAEDLVGNWNTTEVSFTVDTEPPNLTAMQPVNGANISSNFTVNATWKDATSAVSADFSLENSTGSFASGALNGTVDVSEIEDGSYALSYNATDFAGNYNNTTIDLEIDTGKPSASVSRPAENGNVSGNFSLNATWSDAITGVNTSEYYLYNSSGLQRNGSLNATVNSTLLSDGGYSVNFSFTDYSGNVLNVSRELNVDNSPPSFTISQPVDSGNISSNLTVSATFSDATGVRNSTYRFFNSTGNVSSRRNTSLDFNTTYLKDGGYNLSFWMNDTLGNARLHNVTGLTVDNTHPSIDTTSYNSSGWVKDQRTVGIECSDSLTGVENATSAISGDIQEFSAGSYPVNFTLSANGNNTYVFACEDYAGNNRTEERSLEIDSESPSFESADPVNDSSDVDQSFSLEVDFDSEDQESGVNVSNSSASVSEGSMDGISWTNSTFEADLSGLEYSESFGVDLKVSDRVGHSESIELSYQVKDEPSSDSDSGSDGGGGGGGGGSGGLNLAGAGDVSDESGDEKKAEVRKTAEGVSIPDVELTSDPQRFEVDSPDLEVESIEVSGDGNAGFSISEPEEDEQPPEDTEEYSSFNLSRNGTGELDMNISFRVNSSWFENRSADPDSISLYRRNQSSWQNLETRLKSKQSDSYRYSSRVPGFSRFMIAASRSCTTVYGVEDGICREYTSCDIPEGVERVESCRNQSEGDASDESPGRKVVIPGVNPALVIGPLIIFLASLILYRKREMFEDFFRDEPDFDSLSGDK